MKLQIIIPGKRLTVDLPDETCERHFADFVSQLLFEELPTPTAVERSEPFEKVISSVPTPSKTAYYLECPHCSKRSGFTWMGKLKHFKCRNCHLSSDIDHDSLAKIDFACECGAQDVYLTNVTDVRFEMPCFICHGSVDVVYDDKAERFGVEENQ